MLEQVGGRGVVRAPEQSLHDLMQSLVPSGQAGMVVRGRFAVAENGAVYVDAADLGARTDVVAAEQLMLAVPLTAIVATMHEAVRRIPGDSQCGWFLSGPSKTADIEQALVIGAQGARTLHVILEP
jgi:L-lactate dehydrogenase complex protein LldG